VLKFKSGTNAAALVVAGPSPRPAPGARCSVRAGRVARRGVL